MTDNAQPITDDTTGERTTVVVTQRVAAPPEAVFPFLIEPERMVRWMGTTARLTPEPGGEFWLDMNGSDIAVGTFTEIDPPRRVAFTWGWDGSDEVPPGSTTVTIDLVAEGSGTVVELRHELPAASADGHEEGWHYFMPFLTALFETS